jgi:hypothetical protein
MCAGCTRWPECFRRGWQRGWQAAPDARSDRAVAGLLPHSRFHDPRHAAATFLLAQGMTLDDVEQLPRPHLEHVRARPRVGGRWHRRWT